jgi:hypothetical protein
MNYFNSLEKIKLITNKDKSFRKIMIINKKNFKHLLTTFNRKNYNNPKSK